MSLDGDDQIYPSGFAGLIDRLEQRQQPYDDPLSSLPDADVDLNALRLQTVVAPAGPGPQDWRHDIDRKCESLTHELAGYSHLALLHALVIAILRRRDPPNRAKTLFFRIWDEQGHAIAQDLPARWLISAATTFADHGRTGDQRVAGMGLSMLFDMIKLHDSERRLSGRSNADPFRHRKHRDRASLAFDMTPYALNHRGDMDRTILARLWQVGTADETITPLTMRMLSLVMSDPRSVFARVQHFKQRSER